MIEISKNTKDFIAANINADVIKLVLSKNKFKDTDIEFAINQIAGRQKIRKKLPQFYSNLNLILPKSLSLEQSSSEITADFKAHITNFEVSADLCGGMGLDSLAFAKLAKKHYYIEKDKELCDIFEHNAKVLGFTNIEIVNTDALSFLKGCKVLPELIYLDPARRSVSGQKTYFLEDTEPNPVTIVDFLRNSQSKIIIKTSPMLDKIGAERQLKNVEKVFAVSSENECKELIFFIDFKNAASKTSYISVDFNKAGKIEFKFDNNNTVAIAYSNPLNYLYEANPAIMKLGMWNEISSELNAPLLAPNTHYFTSYNLIETFPGRKFKIIQSGKYSKKELLKLIPDKKANLAVKNFDYTVEQLRKMLNLKEGGDIYIFIAKNQFDEALYMICNKA